MQPLRTAIIQHTTAHDIHHDWLIEDPRLPNPYAPDTRLWTARIAPPPSQWAKLGRFNLDIITPHRRAYLTYQGPVSKHRGRVARVAEGICLVECWTPSRIVIQLQTTKDFNQVEMHQLTGDRWLAQYR